MAVAKPLTVVALGQSLIKRDLPALRAARDLLPSADVVFTNFEGTINGRHGGWPTRTGFVSAVDPALLDVLAGLGVTALSLSNNHAFDLGPGGVLSTLEEVARRGFLHAGIGQDLHSASRPGIIETTCGRVALVAADAGPAAPGSSATNQVPARPGVNPLSVVPVTMVRPEEFALLRSIEDELGHRAGRRAYRTTPDGAAADRLDFYGMVFTSGDRRARLGEVDQADLHRNLAAIRDAAAEACCVIAYLHHHHWEPVWEHIPAWTRTYARACIDAGADLFVSHGVPLLQGIEIYSGRPIFYSLGNFIFHSANPGSWTHPDIRRSVVATCRFAAAGLAELTLRPIVIAEAPAPADPSSAALILQKLAALSAPLGTVITIADGIGRVVM